MDKMLLLTLILYAFMTVDASRIGESSSIEHRRSLSKSLLHTLFNSNPTPSVDACWGDIEINNGEKKPAINCIFNVPISEDYNSASEIRRGTCLDFVEPACDPNIHEECDDRSSFMLSSEGKIRTVAYPTLDELELDTPEVNHTYCARADVYQVVDSTGRQLSIAHASKELHIKFSGIVGRDDEEEEYFVNYVEEEDSTKDDDLPMALILVGSLAGALVVLSIVVIGVVKRYKGGLQIHDSTIKMPRIPRRRT